MALWAKNKVNFSVAFTEDAADQTLLAAIEKELSLTKYQTFSNLCKQALWQFLSVSVSESESAGSTPSFQRLEQRIAELAAKFAEFEHNVSAEELSRLEGLEHHLNQLSAQLSKLQGSVDGKVSFAQVSKVVEPDAVESKSVADDVVSDAEVAPHRESDPLLDRLSSLLPQDF
jgi:DNA mismatch repair ATPase MutS